MSTEAPLPQNATPHARRALPDQPVGRWTVLAGRSTAGFHVRDKLVTTVHGTMPVVGGAVAAAEDGAVTAYVEVGVAGIDTGNARRDRDLHKPPFLDVEAHPVVRLEVTGVTATDDGWTAEARVHARGRTAPVTLAVRRTDAGGDDLRLHVTGRLDRAALGIRAPSFIIGRHVDLEADLALGSTPA
jgi:polyisoprenoid-binding protein YceI